MYLFIHKVSSKFKNMLLFFTFIDKIVYLEISQVSIKGYLLEVKKNNG